MKKTKIMSFILAVTAVLCMIPFSVSAAAEVLTYGDERIALVSSFGRINYEGKSHETFKNFNDAINALGKEGGKILFNGNAALADFSDIDGRAPVTIEGIGSKASGNVLDFSGHGDVELKGDLTLSFLNLRLDEGAYILTNGYEFNTVNDFDTYNTARYIKAEGVTIYEYPNPPSVAPGTISSGTGAIYLDSGTYTTVASGSVNSKKVDGNTFVKLGGGNIENAVAGNVGNGTMNGDSSLVINDGAVTKLVVGSSGGTLNGNVTAEINGGKIIDAVLGAENGASVNGNVVLIVSGGSIENEITTGNGTVSGKKIVIKNSVASANIASGAADHIISIDGGICEPVFDGTTLTGFLVTDEYGIPAASATVNGSTVQSANGIYQLPAGISSVAVQTNVTLSVNRNAVYVAGYEDGTFLPQNNMTRAEAITLLTRLITDENNIKSVTANFNDVESGAWYEPYIGFFQKLGFLDTVATDYGASISPNQNITRSEFAELLYHIADFSSDASSMKLKSFSDVPSDHPYAGAINYAVANSIVTGYDDGTFKPENNITRAEVVTMVNRFLGRIPNGAEGSISFSDIGTHWAKSQILAAAGTENVTWTPEAEAAQYVLSGTSAPDYIKGLYEQSANLEAPAIRAGIDTIAEQMKKDILNTPNTLDIYADKITKQIYYVSEKNGNDENDGKTPETAFKTIAGLKNMRLAGAGTAILFERGGVYRGTLGTSLGFIYGAYGEGPKPIIMQSKKNYADESLWQETEWENVWVCTDKLINVGIIAFDHDIQDYSTDSYNELYGLTMNKNQFGFDGVHELCGDLQFYSELNESTNQAGELYVYSTKGNPGKRFKSIEIGENIDIVEGNGTNVIIDNISFKFTGAHGIAYGTTKNITVTNCVFSWIGGSTLSLNFHGIGRPVNYGNAVQIYGGCNGYYVKNNWMYQIYDTAVTHQRSTSVGDCRQENIDYMNNLMEYVYWGIEFYNKPPTSEMLEGKKDTYTRTTKNVHSAYNLLRLGGYGWGSIVRYRTCELYSGATLPDDNSGCVTEYNIFDRAYGQLLYLPSNATELEDKNIYVQTIGQPLGRLKGTSVTCGYDAANKIADLWGDKNAVVIVIDPAKEPVVRNIPDGLAPKEL